MAAEPSRRPDAADRFDAIVIGSGFGGSVTACRLAQRGRRVLLLERGQPWPAGSFPRTPRQTARAFWAPRAGEHGLYDVRSFSRLRAVVSSGLGGGSLIYANVMLRKDPATFVDHEHERWPLHYDDLVEGYERVEAMAGATPYPFEHEPYASTPKTRAMLDAARAIGLSGELPPLAIAFAPDAGATPWPGVGLADSGSVHGHGTRSTCRLCGECVIGCQFGAKNTLDYTYLRTARDAGATIRTCCEAVELHRDDDGWVVTYRQHLAARAGHPEHLLDPVPRSPRHVGAPQVVLAAGTLGSTALLLRNRASLPGLSPMLGRRFSANGDLLMFVRGADRRLDPSHGPTITASIRARDRASPSGRGFFLQDAGAPAASEWLWHGLDVPGDAWRLRSALWRRLGRRVRGRSQPQLGALLAAGLGSGRSSSAMLPLLGMGRDIPDGRLTLRGDSLDLSWREVPSRAFFEGLEDGGRRVGRALGGRAHRPLGRLARLVTVHPLGGCPMGATAVDGVVDPWGAVHGAPGLWVADGSVMPGPVGANPSLTIAALAERSADAIAPPP